MKEWIREDEFGNIVARGIVGEDDPYDPKVFDRKKAEVEGEAEETKPAPVEGATTNRWGLRRRCKSIFVTIFSFAS